MNFTTMKKLIIIAIAGLSLTSCTKQTQKYTCKIVQTTAVNGVVTSPYIAYATVTGNLWDVIRYEQDHTWVDSSNGNYITSECHCWLEGENQPEIHN